MSLDSPHVRSDAELTASQPKIEVSAVATETPVLDEMKGEQPASTPEVAIEPSRPEKPTTADLTPEVKPLKTESIESVEAAAPVPAPSREPDFDAIIAFPSTQSTTEPKKRKRPRRKAAEPVRRNNVVNHVQKNQPVQFAPRPTAASPQPTNSSQRSTSPALKKESGEFKFEELKKGEIEINLD
ncbi:hypothetical protein IPJ72_04310 [Candidatus Peregrinibacteria bacterium]|nr:MAG: hypothetical protein IPJ72_04310 [Candidatus Peregrinibacteria bacterium]